MIFDNLNKASVALNLKERNLSLKVPDHLNLIERTWIVLLVSL